MDDDIRDYAYHLFVEEAPELLQTLETGLLSIGQNRSPAQVHTLMRAAHSLKGNAASLGFDELKRLAHRFEDAIKTLHSDQLVVTPELESRFLSACDCLQAAINTGIQSGEFLPPSQAEAVFAQLETQLAHVDPSQFDLPSSQDMGIDLRRTLFEVDIARALTELQEALSPDPSSSSGLATLQTTAQTFHDLGQMLDLADFADISSRVVQLLQTNPEVAAQVAPLAMEAWQSSRSAILADRDPPALSAFPPLTALLRHFGQEIADEPDTIAHFFEPEQRQPDFEGAFDWGSPTVEVEISGVKDPLLDQVDIEPDLEGAFDWGSPTLEPESSDLEESPPLTEGSAIDIDLLSLDDFSLNAESPEALTEESPTEVRKELEEGRDDLSHVVPTLAEDPSRAISVRVSLGQLETVTSQAAELSISRNQLQRQQQVFRQTVTRLQQKVSQLQNHGIRLDQLADQLVTAQAITAHSPWPVPTTSAGGTSSWQQGFDALELDRYSTLSLEIQEVLESVAQITETTADLTLYLDQSEQTLRLHASGLTALNDDLMAARMVPLGKVFERLPRVVRDLAVAQQKQVQLEIQGSQVWVDKPVLDQLYTPLLHLVRNAVDHGIETPAERLAPSPSSQGSKSEPPQIRITAYRQGGQVVIQVRDNGRGIDRAAVKQRAIQHQLLTPTQLDTLTDPALLDLIFTPGFTTADRISEVSGRGVGLDDVRTQITALKGSVAVTSTPGQGTTFTLRIPLTLGLAQLTLCGVGRSTFAFPVDTITEIIQVPQVASTSQISVEWRQQSVTIRPLQSLLRYSTAASALVSDPVAPQDPQTVLIFERDKEVVGIAVDRLVAQLELAVKPLGSELAAPGYFYGFTVGATGILIPVLDGWALGQHQGSLSGEVAAACHLPKTERTRILVVEDSLVMRRVLVQQLERADFEVMQAKDGQEAWEQLEQMPPVDLILCDVEMPRMNGFELLHQRRQNPAFQGIPVVMLTSRSGQKHRQLATLLGANAYLTKPCLQYELLATVNKVLSEKPLETASASHLSPPVR
jgi:chemotaxis family two-component system sensor histidine kinase/response regulator PixL